MIVAANPEKPKPTNAEAAIAAAQDRRATEDLPYFGAVVPVEAQALLDALPNAQLIDVRTRAEWDYVGRVPGSILIEWNTYPSGARNPAFLEQLRAAAADPDTPLLFFCRSGQRSATTARAPAAPGYNMPLNPLQGCEGAKEVAALPGALVREHSE